MNEAKQTSPVKTPSIDDYCLHCIRARKLTLVGDCALHKGVPAGAFMVADWWDFVLTQDTEALKKAAANALRPGSMVAVPPRGAGLTDTEHRLVKGWAEEVFNNMLHPAHLADRVSALIAMKAIGAGSRGEVGGG